MNENLFNDAIVRRTVSQALVTVEGELSLYEKLKPEIKNVYEDIERLLNFEAVVFPNIDNDDYETPDPELWEKIQDFVVLVAFANSIHSLDLVLTPNGFGIVSNQTLAPASTSRVEDCRKEQLQKARTLLNSISYDLSRLGEYQNTANYARMISTPCFYGEYISDTTFADGHNLAQKIINDLNTFVVHCEYVDRMFMGNDFALALRIKALQNDLTQTEFRLFQQYKAVCQLCSETPLEQRHLFPFVLAAENLIDILRYNPEAFSVWHASEVGQSYLNSPAYKNEMEKGGFWL